MKKLTVFLIFLGVATAISISLGVYLIFYFDSLLKKSIIENAILKEDSESFQRWKEFQGFIDFYVFNVTNAEEVAHDNVKPVVEELGPYKYRELRTKLDIRFSERNDTVTYKEQKYFILDSSSGLLEEDSVNVLNMPAIIISKILEDNLPTFLLNALKWLMKSEKLFERRSVKEIIWGYNATLAIKINEILQKIGFSPIKFPEFGLYVGKRKNGSLSETFNISTGLIDINEIGKINYWNGESELPYWSGKSCNSINGTDGTFWSPFINKSSFLYIYNPEICRSIELEFNSEHKIMNANTYKFTIPPSAFQDFRNSSEFQCFCVPNIESCLKKGVLDISTCNAGAPVVVSMPHFLNSDSDYIGAIHGMSPNASKHETFINVEPHMGVALEAHKRLQMNLILRRYKAFPATSKFEGVLIFPIAWADENGLLSAEDSKELDEKLYRPLLIAQCVQYGLIVLGCLCLLSIILIQILKVKKNENVETEIIDERTSLLSESQPVG